MSRKKLGKSFSNLGLTELLSDFTAVSTDPLPFTSSETAPTFTGLQQLLLTQLIPSQFQPRKQFDEASLEELATSIRNQGIIQPIIARQIQNQNHLPQFEIIAGERRWRAAKLAGLEFIPVIIKAIKDQDAMAISLIENIQRRDLNVLEEAQALQRLLTEFQLTHQEVAHAVGKSRTAITNLLRLLNLNSEVKLLLANQQLEMGHARTLLALDIKEQVSAAHYMIAKELSVRAAEAFVRQLLTPKKLSVAPINSSLNDPNGEIKSIQQHIEQLLNTKVVIKHQASGRGKLVIHYKNWDRLNEILKNLDQN